MDAPRFYFLTGCASGIGRHLSDRLIARGDHLFATDINIEALAAYAREHGWPEDRVRIRRLDVRDPEDWRAAMSEAMAAFGRIDVAMNIAGYMMAGWAHEAPREEVDRHFDINVKGVIYGTQEAARRMIAQGGGQILNIASIAALAPISGISLYTASKYAVRAFSLAAAQELRPHGVAVTTLCPDAIRTPLLDPQKNLEAGAVVFSTPRLFTVEEIGDVILRRAIPRRPLQIILPASRGWLAHLANMLPELAFTLGPFFRRRGAEKQRAFFAEQK